MRITLCICTYNRGTIIPYCLRSILSLDIPDAVSAEILVVDNNSTDDTQVVVAGILQGAALPGRLLVEPVQGISNARQRAVKEFSGDYLAFLDDECVLPTDWLANAVRIINENQPAILGGPHRAAFLPDTARPIWYKDSYGDASILAMKWERGYQPSFRANGANMVIRADVLSEMTFDPNFGMNGSNVSLGEEGEAQDRYLASHPGESVFYAPELVLYHFVLPHKMNLRYRLKRVLAPNARHTADQRRMGLVNSMGRLLAKSSILAIKALFRSRKKYPYIQNYLYERALPWLTPELRALVRR